MHEGPGPANDRIVAEEEFNLSVENVKSLLTVCVDMRRRLLCPRRKRAFHQRKGPVRACAGRLEEHGASSSTKHFALAGLEDNRLVSHIHLYVSLSSHFSSSEPCIVRISATLKMLYPSSNRNGPLSIYYLFPISHWASLRIDKSAMSLKDISRLLFTVFLVSSITSRSPFSQVLISSS